MEGVEGWVTGQLRCPTCWTTLSYGNNDLECSSCAVRYPIQDGIPKLQPFRNIFSPRGFSLDRKYEERGETSSVSALFPSERRLRLTLDMIEGRRLLEIGCAEGWMTERLVERAREVVSSDISHAYLRRAKDKGIRAQFVQLDAHYLPFTSASFDCVVITEVLEHVFSPYRVLEEIHRVLHERGILVLSVPNQLSSYNLLQHLINRPVTDKSAHIGFYDMFAVSRLLRFVGFDIERTKSGFVHLPLMKRLFYSDLLQDFLQVFFKNFGDRLILKAVKGENSLWDEI